MKLFSALCRGFKIPGARFRGKVRMVKRVTSLAMNDMITDYKIEEMNMLYLRNPYLTLEQSQRVTKLLEEKAKNEKEYLVGKVKAIDEKFASKSTRIVDKLMKLRVNEDWDVIK